MLAAVFPPLIVTSDFIVEKITFAKDITEKSVIKFICFLLSVFCTGQLYPKKEIFLKNNMSG